MGKVTEAKYTHRNTGYIKCRGCSALKGKKRTFWLGICTSKAENLSQTPRIKKHKEFGWLARCGESCWAKLLLHHALVLNSSLKH